MSTGAEGPTGEVRRPVTVTYEGAVARVVMDDASHRNRLTPQLLQDVPDALRAAAASPHVRVVVLGGREDVFCLGARREDLLSIRTGEFTAEYADDCVRSPLRCPLPVVGAMRGHSIGGGLLLGLYCDIVVMSERSLYSANFLQYGFTPCLGATVLLAQRLGPLLGTELLLTGGRYQGRALRARAAPVRVVPHDEVDATCMLLAEQLARVPRTTLRLMKTHAAASLLEATDRVLPEELRLQAATIRLPEAEHLLESYAPPSAQPS